MKTLYSFKTPDDASVFFKYLRKIAHFQLNSGAALTQLELGELMSRIERLSKRDTPMIPLADPTVRVICRLADMFFTCYNLYF